MPETQNTTDNDAAISGNASQARPNDAESETFDYSHVRTTARIAVYDDLKSAPHIMKIEPARTNEYIERLASTIDEQAKRLGGKIPYTVIREVSENFIHAQFREVVVSILDAGNTIRFADQGPGIQEKEKAQKPGFTSATEPMKDYIRGVGSGLPIVRDYLDVFDGSIIIEDNLTTGAVITVTLVNPANIPSDPDPASELHPAATPDPHAQTITNVPAQQPQQPISTGTIAGFPVVATNTVPATYIPRPPLTPREEMLVKLLFHEGDLGVSDLSELSGIPMSSTHTTLGKLEQAGLVQKGPGKKRALTPIGAQIAPTL